MSYTPTVWKSGDVVSSIKLNKLENGVAAAAVANGQRYVNISDYIYTGKANEDGTFGTRTDMRYILKECIGLASLTVHVRTWDFPVIVFYDATGNVLSTVDGARNGEQTINANFPSGAKQYAVNTPFNETAMGLFSVLEKYERIDLLDAEMEIKQDKSVDVSIDISNGLKAGSISTSGVITPANTNFVHILRNCEAVSKLTVTSTLWSDPRIVYYDENMGFISYVSGPLNGKNTIISYPPANAKFYAAVTLAQYVSDFAIIETWRLTDKVEEMNETIIKNSPEYASFFLPDWYPAVVGFPSFVYLENIIKYGFLKDYEVLAGAQDVSFIGAKPECDLFTPNAAGNENREYRLYDKNKEIAKGVTERRTVAANAGGSATVLIIGDSKSEATPPWVTLDTLLTADASMNLTFIGTVASGPIRREAYSGKSIVNVCDDEYITGTTPNVFYDASVTTEHSHHFSFAKAVATLGATPDIVFIDLGANQFWSDWSVIRGCYDDVISSIHAVDDSIKIVVCLQEGSCLTPQITYANGVKSWMYYLGGTHASEEKMFEEYGGRESENIFIQPQYLCVDLYRDYPICRLPKFDGAAGEIDFCVDVTHPGLNTGPWDASVTYNRGAWIYKGGSGYACKRTCTNVDPETDDGTYWSKCENLNDGYIKKGYFYYYMLKYLMTV